MPIFLRSVARSLCLLLGAWLFAIMLFSPAAQAREVDWAAVSDRAMPAVVRIEIGSKGPRGSGFVVDPRGYILTNAHVVGDAQVVTVHFENGRHAVAKVVATDGWVDLALLKIDGDGRFPSLAFAPQTSVRRGDPVAALGSPLDYAFSLSRGVVSGFDRTYTEQDAVGFLQHDAAINPGSSGGPLVDRQGRVVGVNAATPPDASTDIGIALAIPVGIAELFVRRAQDGGTAGHGVLGVRTRQVTAGIAMALGLASSEGLLVEHVVPGSAAASAGMQVGDVLRALDGIALTTPRRLGEQVWRRAPGAKILLSVERGAQTLAIALTLDEPTAASRFAGGAGATSLRPERPRLTGYGLTLQWRTEGSETGIEVSAVLPQSPASAAGLGRGDRVLALNGQSPTSLAEAEALIASADGTIVVLVSRPGAEQQYVVLSTLDAPTVPVGATF